MQCGLIFFIQVLYLGMGMPLHSNAFTKSVKPLHGLVTINQSSTPHEHKLQNMLCHLKYFPILGIFLCAIRKNVSI